MAADQTPPAAATTPDAESTAFVINGHRWFDLDLRERPGRDEVQVASVAIDLGAEGLLSPHQLTWDPVTRMCLALYPDRGLGDYLQGDCEPDGVDLTPVVVALGRAALAAGVIGEDEWTDFVRREDLDDGVEG